MAARSSILIVCEGSETEPNYLDALAREYGLTNLVIPRTNRTDPIGLVKEAKGALCTRRSKVDRAFVVCDRDEHPSFDAACEAVRQFRQNDERLELVASIPCFEVWLLLHFGYTSAPMTKEEALARLKAKFPSYDKSDLSCMDEFIMRVPDAIRNSKRLHAEAVKNGDLNCSSRMHVLIEALLPDLVIGG